MSARLVLFELLGQHGLAEIEVLPRRLEVGLGCAAGEATVVGEFDVFCEV